MNSNKMLAVLLIALCPLAVFSSEPDTAPIKSQVVEQQLNNDSEQRAEEEKVYLLELEKFKNEVESEATSQDIPCQVRPYC